MKRLRKPMKTDILANIFDKVGRSIKVSEVCEVTGIKNPNSLKALCSYLRKDSHIPEENRVDIRIKDDFCIRVN